MVARELQSLRRLVTTANEFYWCCEASRSPTLHQLLILVEDVTRVAETLQMTNEQRASLLEAAHWYSPSLPFPD